MTSSNRVGLSYVRGVTPGVVPASPRMRAVRYVSESLSWSPEYIDSDEIREDRMMSDPILTMQAAAGGVSTEFSYPQPNSFQSDALRSLMWNDWVNTPERDNDGTADSVITDIGTVAGTITFTTGAAFIVNHLVRTTGFANAANNGVNVVTTGGATSLVASGAAFVAETAPPAAARVKAVGFQGASGDIAAVADGITSTAAVFTTLGLQVGQWINLGGVAAATRFTAVPADNAWGRITAIAAGKLTLDNLPAGWGADAGTGKTIRIWFGDVIKNGTARTELHFEKRYLGQTAPSYLTFQSQVANTLELTIASRAKVTAAYGFIGLTGTASGTTLDAVVDEATTNAVIGANASVGRLSDGGAALGSPNWARSFSVSVNNNMRTIESVDSQAPVDTREGEFTVTGRIETYFGSRTLLDKFYAGTPTAIHSRINKNNQAVLFTVPRATYRSDGVPSVGGKNQDVMLPLGYQASRDPLTAAHLQIDRLEFFEP